ncbi:MAG TPA: DUF167 domain-containing protein [Acidimicrobiales bacterium]|nr:DUF167 domain-containing protein [Acidimicrobiales bacterium]
MAPDAASSPRGSAASAPEPSRLLEVTGKGILLRVHVQPGAVAEGVAGLHGDALKVKVRPRATKGKANDALIDLLSRLLGVGRGNLEIASGLASRDKRVRVTGHDFASVQARLSALSEQGRSNL